MWQKDYFLSDYIQNWKIFLIYQLMNHTWTGLVSMLSSYLKTFENRIPNDIVLLFEEAKQIINNKLAGYLQ